MPFPAIELTDDDAPAFVRNVDHIVAGLIFRYRPALVCLIRVRRWFDHQWFVGIVCVVDPVQPWQLREVKGLGRCEVRELLDHPPRVLPV